MQLWQLDVTASAFLTNGRELKIVTGIDDHSRYCLIAKAVLRATARPVCQAFLDAMQAYGVPEEVLSDNGTVFTGRFIKPRPAEVLFERISRENGITQRLTKPRSPTTTGKIERLHQSLQNELPNDHGPFDSIEDLQAALDTWRQEYNTDRPHQSLGMAFPVSRFGPAASDLELRVPARQGLTAALEQEVAPGVTTSPSPASSRIALEAERLVPASGNLWIGGQQIWLGPALAGREVTIWVDETTLHVLLDGTRLKTVPSRLGVIELARLAADGARLAGAPPIAGGPGTAVEVDRLVNGAGLVSLASRQLNVGYELAGQRVTLRLDGTQMAVVSHDGELLRALPCPVPTADRHRLRGARRALSTPVPAAGPITVQRRVSQRGSIMVATQRIHVGMIHARKVVTVTASNHSFQIGLGSETVCVVPRTTTREIHRYKAHRTGRKPADN